MHDLAYKRAGRPLALKALGAGCCNFNRCRAYTKTSFHERLRNSRIVDQLPENGSAVDCPRCGLVHKVRYDRICQNQITLPERGAGALLHYSYHIYISILWLKNYALARLSLYLSFSHPHTHTSVFPHPPLEGNEADLHGQNQPITQGQSMQIMQTPP